MKVVWHPENKYSTIKKAKILRMYESYALVEVIVNNEGLRFKKGYCYTDMEV